MEQKPSVGRVVHYVSEGSPVRADGSQKYTSQCRAATVTEVSETESYKVGLHIVNPTGELFLSLAQGGCMADFTERLGGSWHWPERV